MLTLVVWLPVVADQLHPSDHLAYGEETKDLASDDGVCR